MVYRDEVPGLEPRETRGTRLWADSFDWLAVRGFRLRHMRE